MKKNILLVGESWVSAVNHFKGFDTFATVSSAVGIKPLAEALEGSDFKLTHMHSQDAVEGFPYTLEGLSSYDAILLSDIGSNSFLLPQDVWLQGKTVPNRLTLINQWCRQGGGLMMIGGYLSFQGIDGRARWRRTPVEAALPVECHPFDDRIEAPEGIIAEILEPDHPIVAGITGPWPPLLGANEVIAKPDATVIARLPAEQGHHPLLVAGRFGAGRTLAWTSDVAPHWLPETFSNWPGYKKLWTQALTWLTRRDG